jgi:hypothetical protein
MKSKQENRQQAGESQENIEIKPSFVDPKLVRHGKVNEITKFWGHKSFGSFYH